MRKLLILATLLANFLTAYSQNVNIPDANFKTALVSNAAINTDGDMEISTAEAMAFSGTITITDQNVSDLTGIEAFVNLDRLICVGTSITSLDVSKITQLTLLRCSINQLNSLDVSKNLNLTRLEVSNNQLTTLTIGENTSLATLLFPNNQLASLDISQATALVSLDGDNNQLTSFDISKNKSLEQLFLRGNLLNTLNLANGNNAAITNMETTNNPDLSCIQHDTGFSPPSLANGWVIDATTSFSDVCSGSQLAIIPQTVSTNASGSVCLDGNQSYTVTVNGSQTGVDYFLTDVDQEIVLDGPAAGTGNPIEFGTGNLDQNTSFEVIGQMTNESESALAFRRDGDEAIASASWDFDYSQGYTLEFVYSGTTDPFFFQNALFSIGNEAISDLEVYFQDRTSTLVVYHNRGATAGQFNRYTSPAADVKVHITIVYDMDNGLSVYYDGVEQNVAFPNDPLISAQSMQKSNNVTWKIGAIAHAAFGDTENAAGVFDEVRVWNINRSQDEIETSRNSCIATNTQHLVHYYPMNDSRGNLVEDATGVLDLNISNVDNSNNWEPALISCTDPDPALLFEKDKDFASASASWNFDYSLGYTLEFNFSGTTNPSDFQNALFSIGESAISDLEVYFQQGTGLFTIVHNRGTSNIRFNRYLAPASNRHTHIAIIYDPAVGLSVYYNGEAQSIAFPNDDPIINANSLMKTAGDLTWKLGEIAHQDFGNTANSEGLLDEIRIWSTIRSQDEIDSNRNGCVSNTSTGLSHYYRLNEGSGSVINDAVSDLHLNISNADASSNWINELVSCLGSPSQRVPMANSVTIGDLEEPQLIVLPAFDLTLNGSGNATLNLADIVTAASDNCTDSTALIFSASLTEFNCMDLGVNNVEIMIADESGNETVQTTEVTVIDDFSPTVFADDLIVPTDADNCEASNVQYSQNLGFTDNCDRGVNTSFSIPAGSTLTLGNHTVTYTATDQSGNSSSVDFIVSVVDQEAPQIVSCLNDTIVIADQSNDYTVPDFSQLANLLVNDNCGSVTISQSVASGSTLNLGMHDIQLTFTDDAGNTSTCDFNVTVNQVLSSADRQSDHAISVYPNPAKNHLSVDSRSRVHQIRIMTLAGNLMMQTSEKKVSLVSFKRGIYLLEIDTDQGTSVQKIIKE
ncbi:MAG: LamG-like jellyroll fold domain-containing protein [Bacteroidota bacterium]